MATRLCGWAAIEFAERCGALLSKHAESGEEARDDLSLAEAREVAKRNPDLVFIDFDEEAMGSSGVA